jgi:hypothetical protein
VAAPTITASASGPGEGEGQGGLQRIAAAFGDQTPGARKTADGRRAQVARGPIGRQEQQAVQEDRAQMHLDPHFAHGGQGPVHQQALIEEAGGGLDEVGTESTRQAGRIVGGVGRNANALEQAGVAHFQQPLPQGLAVGGEQVAGGLDHDGVGAHKSQAGERRPRLLLDEFRSAIAAGRLDRDLERGWAGHDRAQDRFAVSGGRACVQHLDSGAPGDGQDLARFGVGRAPTGRRTAVEAELSGPETELRYQGMRAQPGGSGRAARRLHHGRQA